MKLVFQIASNTSYSSYRQGLMSLVASGQSHQSVAVGVAVIG